MEKVEESTEQKILKAAEKEFIAKGFDGARTTTIVKAAGVTHAMLHYYFRSKENLFEKVFIEKIELCKNSFLIFFLNKDDGSFFDKLQAAITSHFNYLRTNPELPRFLVNEVFPNFERYGYLIRDALQQVATNFQQHIDAAVKRGEAEPVDAMLVLPSMVSLNLFAFISSPLNSILYDNDMDKVLDMRLAENIEFIIRRIKKK